MISAVLNVINKVVTTLPPVLVLVLLMDFIFVLGLMWFIQSNSVTRIDAVREMFNTCALMGGIIP